jgi:2-amino-4-hydroxy-6-hydroxymethyldihydropteridine diphosphokinase
MRATSGGSGEAQLLIALGSNRRHGRFGSPEQIIRAATKMLPAVGIEVNSTSDVITTEPLGPPQRRYANAVVLCSTELDLGEVLRRLKSLETAFGRVTRRRWGPRVLDLDLIGSGTDICPSGALWRRARGKLVVPHPSMHLRSFVLGPLVQVAPRWRHPVLGLTARQMQARLARRRPLGRSGPALLSAGPAPKVRTVVEARHKAGPIAQR